MRQQRLNARQGRVVADQDEIGKVTCSGGPGLPKGSERQQRTIAVESVINNQDPKIWPDARLRQAIVENKDIDLRAHCNHRHGTSPSIGGHCNRAARSPAQQPGFVAHLLGPPTPQALGQEQARPTVGDQAASTPTQDAGAPPPLRQAQRQRHAGRCLAGTTHNPVSNGHDCSPRVPRRGRLLTESMPTRDQGDECERPPKRGPEQSKHIVCEYRLERAAGHGEPSCPQPDVKPRWFASTCG